MRLDIHAELRNGLTGQRIIWGLRLIEFADQLRV